MKNFFRILRNPRKTAAVSIAPRQESVDSFAASGRASAAFALFAGAVTLAAALPLTASESTPESIEPGSLCIHLYNHAGAPQKSLQRAIAETASVFTRAGIRTSWVQPADLPEAHWIDLSGLNKLLAASQQSCVVVRLVKDLPAAQYPNALGFAFPHARIGVNVEIFYSRVKRQAMAFGVDADALLAYALTHEIGHVLLRSSQHAAVGIMRAQWGRDSIQPASTIAFLPQQARQMRRTAEQFNVQEQTLVATNAPGQN
jgi:hypothetical protein